MTTAAGGGRPTVRELRPTSSSGARETATHPPPPPATHLTNKHSSHSTPITLHMRGSPSLLPTVLPSSAIIGIFLQETDKLSHQSPAQLQPPPRPSSSRETTTGLQLQHHSQENIVSTSLPFPPTTTSSTYGGTGVGASGGFVPLPPVSHPDRDDATRHHLASEVGTIPAAVGAVDTESRGKGRGLEREGRSGESQELEDMFSKTLDSIVDHHFQQLDTSLRKLMTKES